MSEQIQLNTTKVEEPVQVMTKNPKKDEQGKRLTEYNRRKTEELAQKSKAQESEPNLTQAYGIEVVIAVGVLGLLDYLIYQNLSKKDNIAKVNPIRSVEVQI